MKIADMLIVVGTIIVVVGLIIKVFPMFGRLPGDILIKGEGYSVYIPIVSSIVISIVLTVIVNIIIRILGGWR